MLASAGLADSDYAGRNMRDTDGGVGLLNVLTAGAGGAVDVNSEFGRIDDDIADFVGFRKYGNRAGRGVNAPL